MAKRFLSLIIFGLLLVFLMVPQPVFAQQPWAERCVRDVCLVNENPCPPDKLVKNIATIQGFECVVRLILNIVVRLAGIAVFIMILVGGFQYLTSGGNPEKTKKAQATLTWAIAGLTILLLSWFILKFVKTFTGVNVTQFTIPGP